MVEQATQSQDGVSKTTPSLQKISEAMMNTLWDNNEVQFARLLCEIRANISGSDVEWAELKVSMDLTSSDIESIFTRASLVWEKSKSRTIQKNRQRDIYLKNPEGGVVFIPQGWCDEFAQDPDEEPEIMTYISVGPGENGPIDNLYVPISRLDTMQEIAEPKARELHPFLFKTLSLINAGENVRLG